MKRGFLFRLKKVFLNKLLLSVQQGLPLLISS